MRALRRVLLAEFLGTLLLLVGVVGSGIMAARLSPTDVGLQLFQNAAATTAVLVAAISIFRTISADFNPAVTVGAWLLGHRTGRDVPAMVAAQMVGAVAGTTLANLMFDLDAVTWSTTQRTGGHLWLAEAVATVGLLLVVFSLVRTDRSAQVPYVVGVYIGGAYYFTSSTSFANPAVTVGRMFSDTFAGIDPACAPMFVVMQVVGMGLAVLLLRGLFPAQS
ncbi:MAG: aquaporin [Actinomycetota bacterium]|nr:aquaporin [Actinomycetota bacterium]MED6327736.1 aquaporin [Actinomycetota bacterium]MEE2958619.1 aquaporin [Actinomycetota bacterium]